MKNYSDYVDFELAKSLKEIKFPQDRATIREYFDDKHYSEVCTRPTLEEVKNWLFQEKNIWIEIIRCDITELPSTEHGFMWELYDTKNYNRCLGGCEDSELPQSPKEALINAIKKSIKILKK